MMYDGGSGSTVTINRIWWTLCHLKNYFPIQPGARRRLLEHRRARPGFKFGGLYETNLPRNFFIPEYPHFDRAGRVVLLIQPGDTLPDISNNGFCRHCCEAVQNGAFAADKLYFIETKEEVFIHVYREKDIQYTSFYNKVEIILHAHAV